MANDSDKVWIYLEDSNSFKHLDRSDPRFEWDSKFAPRGTVRFKSRINAKSITYVHFGLTREEVALSANRYRLAEVAKLETQLAALKAQMVKP